MAPLAAYIAEFVGGVIVIVDEIIFGDDSAFTEGGGKGLMAFAVASIEHGDGDALAFVTALMSDVGFYLRDLLK